MRGASGPCLPPYFRPWSCSSKKRKNSIYSDAFFLRDGSMRTFPSTYWSLRPLPSGAETGEASRGPRPQEFFFFSPSLNNIYIFSLNNKTINILAPLIWFSGSAPGCHHAFFLQERPWDVLFQPSCIFSTRWVCGETLV